MADFVELLKSLLTDEHGLSREEAETLVRAHTGIVTAGIMGGQIGLRGCAIALMHKRASSPTREQP